MAQDKQALYDSRNRTVQRAIDAVARLNPGEIDEFGAKAEVARENDLEDHNIQYVLRKYEDLIEWRRKQFESPMTVSGAKAVDDPQLKALADGTGEFQVNVQLSLVDVYRAMKALPSDLSTDVWIQTLEQADDIPSRDLRKVVES
jgi:isopropylmalate/homocitrate/citramalate synthase